jgi:beta-carotene hydroxylase
MDRTDPRRERHRVIWLSRLLTLAIASAALGSLAWVPGHPLLWALDALGRTYLMFLGTVMAHEASHGHLGRGRAGNLFWGRLALIPILVPFANFRKTHPLHHAHTNDPQRDPDYFARPTRSWQIPLRALAMPHHWLFWLRRQGRVGRQHVTELLVDYARIATVHLPIALLVGPARYLGGMLPALVLVSLLLWYPFAIKTHEGWSLGQPETRSHDYYGRFMYWFSLGLALHRVHHMQPRLTWLELRAHVKQTPRGQSPWRLGRDLGPA